MNQRFRFQCSSVDTVLIPSDAVNLIHCDSSILSTRCIPFMGNFEVERPCSPDSLHHQTSQRNTKTSFSVISVRGTTFSLNPPLYRKNRVDATSQFVICVSLKKESDSFLIHCVSLSRKHGFWFSWSTLEFLILILILCMLLWFRFLILLTLNHVIH